MKSNSISIFSCTFLICTLFIATSGNANCDYEKILISLRAENKPVTEILKDIEKQTNFTIDVQKTNILDFNKSFVLSQTPLNVALNRLLKNINFSIICDSDTSNLSIKFLDLKTPGTPGPSFANYTNGDDSWTDSMSELESAFNDLRNNNLAPQNSAQKEPEEMEGISSAWQNFAENKGNLPSEPPNLQKTPMDDATAAFNDKKSNNYTEPVNESYQNESNEMDEITVAMNEYNSLGDLERLPPEQEEPNEMSGITKAMEEYNLQHKTE